MLQSFFESYYRLRPVNATFTGIHDHDDRLPDWSPDGLAAGIDEMRGLRASLHVEAGAIKDVAARDAALADAFLEIQLAEHESDHFQRANPSLAAGEAIFGIISLITRPFAPAADRARSVLARLGAIPAFLAGVRWTIAGPVPDEWRLKALRECDGADRLLGDGIQRWLAAEQIDGELPPRVEVAARAAR
jgi:hypothetical protein